MGWPVGQVIGSEPELLDDLGVSRAVFREAVRLLEHHSVATMRRGPGGGLVVTAPETSSLARAATLYLQYNKASAQDIFEARSALELKIVELATQNIDEAGIERLRETVEHEAELQEKCYALGTHEIHLVIADLTGNPAMRLFLEVLTKLSEPDHSNENAADTTKRGREVRRTHKGIADAIVAGDVALARHRMLKHLTAMSRYLESAIATKPRRTARRRKAAG